MCILHTGPEGNMGCSGGFMVASYKYVINNGGIDTEDGYPYLAHVSHDHYFNNSHSILDLKSITIVLYSNKRSVDLRKQISEQRVLLIKG